jgi:CRP-like cAMP-binding protein
MDIEAALDQLYSFISRFVVLTKAEKAQITAIAQMVECRKGNVLLREGEECKSISFVLSGVYRIYKLEQGKEVSSYFCYDRRNPFVASFPSVLTGKPSKEIIECILPGELLTVRYADWAELYRTSFALNTFGRKMAEFNYLLSMERIESLQHQSASDRYQLFHEHYPGLLNMVPHLYIASYLGITPESLSRIRRQ